jgi:hypothetical protein
MERIVTHSTGGGDGTLILPLGPAGYEAKRVRGAEQVPLYSCFWFPRRFDRWTLQRYLKLFGKITRKQLEHALDPAPKTPKAEPAGAEA